MRPEELLRSPAIRAGVGLFETLLVTPAGPILASQHAARMMKSAREMEVAAPTEEQFLAAVAKTNSHPAAAERATRVDWLATGEDLTDSESWTLAVTSRPLPPLTLDRRRSCRLITLPSGYRRTMPACKTTSYLPCVLALREAERAGANEALFVDSSGALLEGTATNLFVMENDGSVITPPADGQILPGVIRAWTIDTLRSIGVRLHEVACSADELRSRGGFVTGSLTGIVPVTRMNGEGVPSGADSILRSLHERWNALLSDQR